MAITFHLKALDTRIPVLIPKRFSSKIWRIGSHGPTKGPKKLQRHSWWRQRKIQNLLIFSIESTKLPASLKDSDELCESSGFKREDKDILKSTILSEYKDGQAIFYRLERPLQICGAVSGSQNTSKQDFPVRNIPFSVVLPWNVARNGVVVSRERLSHRRSISFVHLNE